MPRTIAKDFRIEWLQILDEHGNCDQSLRPSLTDQQIKKLYEELVFARTFDEKAFKLQREGRLGTYASIIGQEAAQVASAFALEPGDWMFPSFREPGASFVRGLPPRMILQYWAGDERGSNIPEGQNDFPITIPVGTQIPIGAGAAWGAKLRGDKIAVLVYLGDGATSKGDFHEGLNLAGVFSLPVVFFCQNNQWAISVPLTRQTAAQTLAQKAMAQPSSLLRSAARTDSRDPGVDAGRSDRRPDRLLAGDVADRRADLVAAAQQLRHAPAAEEAGAAGDEHRPVRVSHRAVPSDRVRCAAPASEPEPAGTAR